MAVAADAARIVAWWLKLRGRTPWESYRPQLEVSTLFARGVERVTAERAAAEPQATAPGGATVEERAALAIPLLQLAREALLDAGVARAFGVTAAAVRRIASALPGDAAVQRAAAAPLQAISASEDKAAAAARAVAATDAAAAELLAEEARAKSAKAAGKKKKGECSAPPSAVETDCQHSAADSGSCALSGAVADSAAAPGLRCCALASCGAKEAHTRHFKSCAACRGVAYCCHAHHAEDWPSHKAACKAARKAKAASEEAGPSNA
jgi:hypothetical protein